MNNKNSRRDFLQKIGLVASGSVLGGAALFSGYQFQHAKKKDSKIKALSVDHQLKEVEGEYEHMAAQAASDLTLRGRQGIAGKRWVMVVDLSKCRNARKCMAACQGAHDLKPEQHHINVLQMQDSENTASYFMPKPCQHCDNPPCVSVCPVDATFKRQDGIVLIDNERCIGCRFCIAACPYSARVFHWTEPKVSEKNIGQAYDVEQNVPQRKGTITKCLFSADKLRIGQQPSCVAACPNGVYYFGDENEDAVTNGTTKETVRLSKLLEDNAGHRLLEELGTKPRVYYLPAKNRLFPFPDDLKKDNKHHA